MNSILVSAVEQIALVKGRTFLLVLLIGFVLIALYYMNRAISTGIAPVIRPLPGINAIAEAVARVAEIGGTIHYYSGTDTGYPGEPESIAAISILSYVSRLAAEYDVPLIATAARADMYTIIDSTVKAGAVSAGKPEAYNPANVRFIAQDQWAYAAGVIGIIKRENVQTNFQFGKSRGSALMIGSAAYDVGAVQISGTSGQLAFMMSVSDYLLIGEEFLAGAAAIRNDPVDAASIGAQDISKAIVILLLILGVILKTMNIEWLSNLMTI